MVDYFRAKDHRAIAQVRASDALETLPQGLPQRKMSCSPSWMNSCKTDSCGSSALDALFLIDEHRRATLEALTTQYVHATSLAREIDDRLWHSVHRYYTLLTRLYRRFLDRCQESPDSLPHDLPQLVLNVMDCQRCVVKWRYFRHQSVEPGIWLQLHQLYAIAEHEGCEAAPLWRHRNVGETTITSTYLQLMMLGTLSSSDMLKHEVEMVVGWLED